MTMPSTLGEPRTAGHWPLSRRSSAQSTRTGEQLTTSRSANLPLGQPALRGAPLDPEHVKPRLLGSWGTTPGCNFIYAHMNRAIRNWDLDAIYIMGRGTAARQRWPTRTSRDLHRAVPRPSRRSRHDQLVQAIQFPRWYPFACFPSGPRFYSRGGERYRLVPRLWRTPSQRGLFVCCIGGNGEAETGRWRRVGTAISSGNPISDGAVLPILHLNGYEVANPTILARIRCGATALLEGYGYEVHWVSGEDPAEMHQLMAETLEDRVIERVTQIQRGRESGQAARPRWPMIVFRSLKGWTGPKVVDGLLTEGTWRSHQVPLAEVRTNPDHLELLESWMSGYRPEELFDEGGTLVPELAALPPKDDRRMSANPRANGGLLLQALDLPDFRDYGVPVDKQGTTLSEATRALGGFLRDVVRRNLSNFRLFGPDEVASNRLQEVFEVTDRQWEAEIRDTDDHLASEGRVMEVLSEHQCQGWLEGYLLTGRHGLFTSYEAFIHIVDSMFNQHAKWLKSTHDIPWRRPIASLNYLLSSHVWRQDHNGFSHQDPGFIDHVVNKKADVIRVYLPPDTNCLLSVADHCLRSRHYVNVIVAGKQPSLNYLSMEDAVLHCTQGIGIWDWASNDGGEPDVVMACCGDVPTLETLAAVDILRFDFRPKGPAG